jgi:Cu2+-exporting ATPase
MMGLNAFYSLAPLDQLPAAIESLPERDYSYLDSDETQQKSVTELNERTRRIRFYLPSIHCTACVWMLEQLPLVVEGIKRTRVNFGSGTLTVDYDPEWIATSKVAAILNSIGYPPVLAGEVGVEEISAEERSLLRRIGVAAVCATNTMMLSVSLFQGFFTGIEEPYGSLFRWLSALLALPAVIYSAVPFYRTALGSLYLGSLHIDLPISIAILAAYGAGIVTLISGGEYVYFDSVTALIFLLLSGRYVQKRAVHRARATSVTAWDMFPAVVRVILDGRTFEKPLAELQVGELFEVFPQERVPSDGIVVSGSSSIETAFLTGESVPRPVAIGDAVLGGAMNTDGRLEVRATAVGKSTRLGRVIAELEHTQEEKSPLENEANRLSGYFVVSVLLLAVLTYVGWYFVDSSRAFDACIALMIVTCPCALGLAIPAAVAVAMSRAQRAQIFVRRSGALETLAAAEHFYFDKTGTLTTGEISVREARIDSQYNGEVATMARFAPAHPVSRALARNFAAAPDVRFDELQLVPGRGVEGVSGGVRLMLGSQAWFLQRGIYVSGEDAHGGSVVYFARGNELCGVFLLDDPIRATARDLIDELTRRRKKVFILSGDLCSVVQRTAIELGIPVENAIGELLPENKAQIVGLDKAVTAFVGDGVNDALAMKAASVGVGLRGGVEATMESADIFISKGDLSGFARALRVAWRTRGTIRRNLIFSVCYNLLGATAAILGFVNPLTAAILMPCSSLTVIFSSIMGRSFEAVQDKMKA